MNVLDSRIIEQKKVKSRNRIKFIEKVGSLTNYKLIKKYKKICMWASIAFVNLTVFTHMNRMILFKKVIKIQNLRIRSKKLLTWLVGVLRIVGKIQKKLRKIRRRVAYKNIEAVVDPIIKFIKKQRTKTINTLFKIVKGIQYMNLLFLLYSKWKNYIELIQRQFRKFVRIKKARVESLVLFYDKYATGCKMWTGFKQSQKKEFVEKFLKIVLRNYSKAMCKFYNDSKPIMKNFSRNMFFLEGNASSEFNGRKINFGQQKRPLFKLLSNKNQILDYVYSYAKVLRKRTELKLQKTLRNSKTIRKA